MPRETSWTTTLFATIGVGVIAVYRSTRLLGYLSMGALDGRVALITGAARGQGRAHAMALAAAGADIVAADAPRPMVGLTYPLGTEADLRDTAKRVEELGTRCLPIALDVRDSAAVGAAVEQTLNSMGSLDIVVANAGIVSTGPLEEVSDEVWRLLVDTNLTGVFHTLRAAIPVMRRQRFGRIVVTSSMGGRMGIPEFPACQGELSPVVQSKSA
jgi:NAD(P)-dependent dehydrogenase (short-subunit alcohol dehydrogenase family)